MRSTLNLLILALLVPLASGCVGSELVVFGEIDWNAILRPNLGSVEGEGRTLVYSDGGAKGDQVVSELEWTTLSMGADSVYGFLPDSRCLWVSAEGAPRLTWDMVLDDLFIEDGDGNARDLSTPRVSFAGERMADPITRETLRVDGQDANVFTRPFSEQTVQLNLRAFTDGGKAPHPFGACFRRDRAPVSADLSSCQGGTHSNSFLPYTGIGCTKPAVGGDVSYEIEASGTMSMEDVVIDDRVIRTPPHAVEPTIMEVDRVRTIARPLEFVEIVMENASCEEVPVELRDFCREKEGDSPDDPPIGRWYWRWFVPSLDLAGQPILDEPHVRGARWEENWSPNVLASSVRVFEYQGEDPETGAHRKSFVTPRRIHINRDELNSVVIDCEEDETGENPNVCPSFFPQTAGVMVTPAYQLAALGLGEVGTTPRKLVWEVEFRTFPDASGFFGVPPVAPGDDLFLEFGLSDGVCSSCLTARIEPSSRDLGLRQLSKENHFPRIFQLTNSGFDVLTIDAVRLTGPSAHDFELELDGIGRLPAVLGAGDAFSIDLRFDSDRFGRHEAMVEVDVRRGTEQRTVAAPVVLRADDVHAVPLPEDIGLWDKDCKDPNGPTSFNPSGYIGYASRIGAIQNAGSFDLHIYSAQVEGPDAVYFSMARWENGTFQPVHDETVPVSDPFIDYAFFYTPPSPFVHHGGHRARVRFGTNAGDILMNLYGQHCPY